MQYSPLVRTVTRTYDSWIIRTYVTLRFRIINTKILDTMLNYIQPDRDLLVLGCGFGLFDLLVGLKWPQKKIYGVDRDERRIQTARRSADQLGLVNNVFDVQDLSVKGVRFGMFDEILMLDILHHLPRGQHDELLRTCHDILRPGGRLILKDIHRGNRFKLFFTWLLDMLMTNWEPVFYRDEDDLRNDLKRFGFNQVIAIRLNDILPYPHIQFVCIKE